MPRLRVKDTTGKAIIRKTEAARLVQEELRAGAHRARFDAGHLPNGPYAYRLTARDKTLVLTMMLVE